MVQRAADSLTNVSSVITNPEISIITPLLLAALTEPGTQTKAGPEPSTASLSPIFLFLVTISLLNPKAGPEPSTA